MAVFSCAVVDGEYVTLSQVARRLLATAEAHAAQTAYDHGLADTV